MRIYYAVLGIALLQSSVHAPSHTYIPIGDNGKTSAFRDNEIEPLDVAAVQVPDEDAPRLQWSTKDDPKWWYPCGQDVCFTSVQPTKWTCADKERILETSESGKHWCRKVQP